MLHPNQFQPDEAWIAFQLNEAPIETELDGSLNCIALMDAASCFILGAELVHAGQPEPSELEARRLFKAARARANALPATLFIPIGKFQTALSAEANRLRISVVPVQESELQVFTGEARQGFKEHEQRR